MYSNLPWSDAALRLLAQCTTEAQQVRPPPPCSLYIGLSERKVSSLYGAKPIYVSTLVLMVRYPNISVDSISSNRHQHVRSIRLYVSLFSTSTTCLWPHVSMSHVSMSLPHTHTHTHTHTRARTRTPPPPHPHRPPTSQSVAKHVHRHAQTERLRQVEATTVFQAQPPQHHLFSNSKDFSYSSHPGPVSSKYNS